MTLFRYGTGRWRRLTRGLLLLVGVTAAIAFAMVGAVIALFVLAAGAIAHTVFVMIRGARAPQAARPSSPDVIDGEFVVVERGTKSLRITH